MFCHAAMPMIATHALSSAYSITSWPLSSRMSRRRRCFITVPSPNQPWNLNECPGVVASRAFVLGAFCDEAPYDRLAWVIAHGAGSELARRLNVVAHAFDEKAHDVHDLHHAARAGASAV